MRDYLIATAIAALAGISGWSLRGTPDIPPPDAPSRARVIVATTPAPVPELHVARAAVPHVANSRRNLFAYVTAPPVLPPLPPRVVTVASPPPVAVAPPSAPTPPSAPQFSYRYIGRFGPSHKSIAVFTRDGELITAQTGTRIGERFVLRAIHNDAVEVEATVAGTVHAIRVPMGR